MVKDKLQTATFAAGCFWGVEEAFHHVKGVKETAVGYMGGAPPAGGEKVTYEDVCTDRTGHAEVVQLQYDLKEVSYQELLKVFWETHDPTTLNRQGVDIGTQYRSAIFFHTPEQEKLAKKSKEELEKSRKFSGKGGKPIVTEITPAATFYRAEEYHQQYLHKQGLKTCRG